MRTSVLFGEKTSDFSIFMVRPHGQGGRGVNFTRFCADVFYGRPLMKHGTVYKNVTSIPKSARFLKFTNIAFSCNNSSYFGILSLVFASFFIVLAPNNSPGSTFSQLLYFPSKSKLITWPQTDETLNFAESPRNLPEKNAQHELPKEVNTHKRYIMFS